MIKKLQNRFTLITMLALTAIFVLLFLSVYFIVANLNDRQTEMTLARIAENDGNPEPAPEGMGPGMLRPPLESRVMGIEELSRYTRYFAVKLDKDGEIIESGSNMNDYFDEQQAYSLAEQAAARGSASGKIGNLQYIMQDKGYGSIVVFADKTMENNMQAHFFQTVFFIVCGAIIALFFVVRKLSAFAIKPAKEAFENQKRFISDASHELKTPTSIISANADVLMGDIGENKWLANIKQQTSRMDVLVRQLLDLSKMDEREENISYASYDVSEEAEGVCMSYESVAFERGVHYSYEVEESLRKTGDPEDIRKLLTILLDNAFKYVDEGGRIEASVARQKKKILVRVFNTGVGITSEEKEKIFDRFYRKDPSRSSKTGGHGLGLAIAQAIVSRYHGGLTVESVPGEWITFFALM